MSISFSIDKSLTGGKSIDSRAIKFHVRTYGIKDGSGRKMYSVQDWVLEELFMITMEVDGKSCELRIGRKPSIKLNKLEGTDVFAHSPTLCLTFPVPIPEQHVMPREEYENMMGEKMARTLGILGAKDAVDKILRSN